MAKRRGSPAAKHKTAKHMSVRSWAGRSRNLDTNLGHGGVFTSAGCLSLQIPCASARTEHRVRGQPPRTFWHVSRRADDRIHHWALAKPRYLVQSAEMKGVGQRKVVNEGAAMVDYHPATLCYTATVSRNGTAIGRVSSSHASITVPPSPPKHYPRSLSFNEKDLEVRLKDVPVF
ncbi:hypothetical protein SKAU_G00162840 [Synaphobranchus kaupii]|uniref:Uncharacterized protein n=1 Tax=Synaphobranchus kaupii TaxID=118154 RepID=A0A9Q1IXU4_SYNKA|nr:hypothetical protein SKAU_G00162840 [Synaphobranchus kaupii]